jgi:chromosome segregation ATPase
MLTMLTSPPVTPETFDERLAQVETTWKARSKQLSDHERHLAERQTRLEGFEKQLTDWEWHLKNTMQVQADEHAKFLQQQRADNERFAGMIKSFGDQLRALEEELKAALMKNIEDHFAFLSAARMRSPAAQKEQSA